jgi:TonB family protein
MAGGARCCPRFYVTQAFRWTNERFALAHEQKRPWKEKQTQGVTANGVQMQGQDGGDFAVRYPFYVEAIRHRIVQNWSQSNIDPAARASHTIHATAAFTINREGAVQEIRIVESSHNASFDNSGLRALFASNPMPPLPADYKGSHVSVTFHFPPPGTH